jgi:hypothetical protein
MGKVIEIATLDEAYIIKQKFLLLNIDYLPVLYHNNTMNLKIVKEEYNNNGFIFSYYYKEHALTLTGGRYIIYDITDDDVNDISSAKVDTLEKACNYIDQLGPNGFFKWD